MIILTDKSKCCGCMACLNSCPVDAIACEEDEGGFLYPVVNLQKCIQCGACDKACHFQSEEKTGQKPISAYSLVYKNRSVLRKSTSGGAFMALSDLILKNGGLVVAACMDEHFTLSHQFAADRCGRDKMQGTFYTQSSIADVFSPLKKELENGVSVLLVGLPCQVAAVRSYLKKEYPNFLTAELLCHGVPSNGFFKEHVRFLEKRYRSKAVHYAFRTKKYGWNPSGIEEITFENGKQVASMAVQSYKKFFHANVSLRPSCLNCQYRSHGRFADITMGDFWGIDKLTGSSPKHGVSCLTANNEKGKAAIEQAAVFADINQFPVQDVLYRISTKLPVSKIDTEEFWAEYRQKGYAGLVKKYCKEPLKMKLYFEMQKHRRKKQEKSNGVEK